MLPPTSSAVGQNGTMNAMNGPFVVSPSPSSDSTANFGLSSETNPFRPRSSAIAPTQPVLPMVEATYQQGFAGDRPWQVVTTHSYPSALNRSTPLYQVPSTQPIDQTPQLQHNVPEYISPWPQQQSQEQQQPQLRQQQQQQATGSQAQAHALDGRPTYSAPLPPPPQHQPQHPHSGMVRSVTMPLVDRSGRQPLHQHMQAQQRHHPYHVQRPLQPQSAGQPISPYPGQQQQQVYHHQQQQEQRHHPQQQYQEQHQPVNQQHQQQPHHQQQHRVQYYVPHPSVNPVGMPPPPPAQPHSQQPLETAPSAPSTPLTPMTMSGDRSLRQLARTYTPVSQLWQAYRALHAHSVTKQARVEQLEKEVRTLLSSPGKGRDKDVHTLSNKLEEVRRRAKNKQEEVSRLRKRADEDRAEMGQLVADIESLMARNKHLESQLAGSQLGSIEPSINHQLDQGTLPASSHLQDSVVQSGKLDHELPQADLAELEDQALRDRQSKDAIELMAKYCTQLDGEDWLMRLLGTGTQTEPEQNLDQVKTNMPESSGSTNVIDLTASSPVMVAKGLGDTDTDIIARSKDDTSDSKVESGLMVEVDKREHPAPKEATTLSTYDSSDRGDGSLNASSDTARLSLFANNAEKFQTMFAETADMSRHVREAALAKCAETPEDEGIKEKARQVTVWANFTDGLIEDTKRIFEEATR